MKKRVVSIIMGGGRGTRLSPLTKLRCKPAVPLGGKYRLVDIPISNCLNSSLNEIYLLTQFNTASLHKHIQNAYKFDNFGGGFVDILSAEQTETGGNWYQGTADAVRQNIKHFGAKDDDLFLILSGDQLYRMDFEDVIRQHMETKADITIAATPVSTLLAPDFGLMRVNDDLTISEFVEKPQDEEVIQSLTLSPKLMEGLEKPEDAEYCLASMGIYVFNAKCILDALEDQSEADDFGKEIIPHLLDTSKMCSYLFDGYWEDIGTVHAFFEANLKLTDPVPPFDFFDEDNPIYGMNSYLPSSKLNACNAENLIIGEGCILDRISAKRCVIGDRARIGHNTTLENVIMMGSDRVDPDHSGLDEHGVGIPPVGIGANCTIRNAIIDKNVRIGDNVVIDPEGKNHNYSKNDIVIKDGIAVVIKNATIPNGFHL
jgi:glucose-1-phosphate adenylyltransferase